MSSTVLLEGSVNTLSEDPLWNGVWRFAKDKKGILQFNYKKKSMEIPGDLLEYVSFMDSATLLFIQNQPKMETQTPKIQRRRGRGRPPSLNRQSNQNISTNSFNTAESKDQENPNNIGQIDNKLDNLDNLDLDNDLLEEHEQLLDDMEESFEDDEKNEIELQLDSESRLLDLESRDLNETNDYELSFNLDENNIEASELTVKEESFSESKDLENQQSFPEMDTATDSIKVKEEIPHKVFENVTINSTSHPLMGLWEGNFSIRSPKGEEFVPETLFFYSTLGAEKLPQFKDLPPEPQFPVSLLKKLELSTKNINKPIITPTIEPSNQNADSTITPPLIKNKVFIFPDQPELDEEQTPTASQLGYTPAALESIYSKVLIGFGRNTIGRFSVAAIYDEKTGEFNCEKRYMNVKFPVKRGRKSHSETGVTNTERPRRQSISSVADGDNDSAMQIRQRTRKPPPYLAEDDQEPSAKRKRSSSTIKLKSGSSDNASVTGSTHAGTSSSTSKNRTSSKALKELEYQAAYASANALLGYRNPDNDDPSISYREAFQDCDTGEIYEGSWAFGYRHGRGICIYSDGLMYEGNWVRGREQGKGDLMTGDRQVIYSGDWLDGMMHGFGIYNFGNGDQYIGDWKESVRCGRGEYIFKNGCRYTGDWKDNKRHGKGRFCWPDGSYYEGEWEFDTKHGRGVLNLVNGFKYDGGWVRNVMEGKGSCTFASGQSYQGTFKSGLRDGRGSITFAEGAVYEGRFREDCLDGQGTLHLTQNVYDDEADTYMIPVQIQSDLWRIHWKAGFGANAH